MASIVWVGVRGGFTDATYAALEEPSVVDPMVDFLAELAGGGDALEFAVGTGRGRAPLRPARCAGPGHRAVTRHGGPAGTQAGCRRSPRGGRGHDHRRVPGRFQLVYVVANSIMNVTTRAGTASGVRERGDPPGPRRTLRGRAGGPPASPVPLSEKGWVFRLDPDHVGIETYDDEVGQVAWSHHWIEVNGRLVHHSEPVPVHLAVGTGPHGEPCGPGPARPLGRLGPLHVHLRQTAKQVAVFARRNGRVRNEHAMSVSFRGT